MHTLRKFVIKNQRQIRLFIFYFGIKQSDKSVWVVLMIDENIKKICYAYRVLSQFKECL